MEGRGDRFGHSYIPRGDYFAHPSSTERDGDHETAGARSYPSKVFESGPANPLTASSKPFGFVTYLSPMQQCTLRWSSLCCEAGIRCQSVFGQLSSLRVETSLLGLRATTPSIIFLSPRPFRRTRPGMLEFTRLHPGFRGSLPLCGLGKVCRHGLQVATAMEFEP